MNDIRRQLLNEALKLIDLAIMLMAFGLSLWVLARHGAVADVLPAGLRLIDVVHWIKIDNVAAMLALVFVWHLALSARGLYNSDRMDAPLSDALRVFRGGVFASLVMALIAVGAFPKLQIEPLRFFITFFIFATGTTVVARLLIRLLLERARLRGRNLRSVLVVGTNSRALAFAETISNRPDLGYYIDGFVDDEWEGISGFRQGGGRLRASLSTLGSYLADHVVDEVVVALPVSRAYLHSKRIVSLCQEQGVAVRFISQIFDPRLAKGKLDVFEGEPMITLQATGEVGFSKLAKRLLDLSVSAVLLLLLAPLLAVVALAVKWTSRGPVFFVQERLGVNKRKFRLVKFRTMVQDAEAKLAEIEHLNEVGGPVFKIEHDPRLTRIGAFLRHSSIDELPQLWNVFRGNMSLVGPRPLPVRDYAGFDDDAHRRRLSVKPGITCLWQVAGRNSIPFEQWMRLDLEYIDQWSFWLDVKILLQTIPVVFGPLFFGRPGEFVKGQQNDPTTASNPSHGG
ncbi:MAG: sugar transferase [Acidobacteriota bacterium]